MPLDTVDNIQKNKKQLGTQAVLDYLNENNSTSKTSASKEIYGSEAGLDVLDTYDKDMLANKNPLYQDINKIRAEEQEKEMIVYGSILLFLITTVFLIFYFLRKQKIKQEIKRQALLQAEIEKKIKIDVQLKNDVTIDWVVSKS